MATVLTDAVAPPGFIVGAGVVAMVVVPSVLALGAGAALAWRQRDWPVSILARVAQVIAVAGVLACPTVAVLQIALTPGGAVARPVSGPLLAVVFAAEIGGYLWLVLRRPGPLGAWRHSGVLGSAAALAVTVVVFLVERQRDPFGNVGVTGAILLAAGGLAAVVRRGGIGQRLRTGAVECLWGVLLNPLAWFSVDLLTTPDDLGHAAILLTGICVLMVLVVLVVCAPWDTRAYRLQ